MTPKHLLIAAALAAPSMASAAEYYDGEHTLLCTIHEIFECTIGSECSEITISEISAPSHFHVDFDNEYLVTTALAAERRETTFDGFRRIDGKMFLQGAEDGEEGIEDGAAWTLSIADPTGTMAMSIIRNDAVLSGFGACTPID